MTKRNTKYHWGIKQILRSGFALAMLVAMIWLPADAGTNPLIYFYNPDANLRDVAELKTQAQNYFRAVDSNVTLRAFLKLKDLESAMGSQPPDFLVVASWVAPSSNAKFGFKPLLMGQVGGQGSYHKVLISKKAFPTTGSVSLSTVGLGKENMASLKSMVPDLKNIPNLNVVEVRKDIDAVLAVSFDQVDLALVRQQNIDAIRKVNANSVQGIQVLATSSPIKYPVFLASSKAEATLVSKFVQGLLSTSSPQATQALQMMGFKSWGKM